LGDDSGAYQPTRTAGLTLQAALLCERIDEDPDGAKTLVRIVDRFFDRNPDSRAAALRFRPALFLNLKRSADDGRTIETQVAIAVIDPAGNTCNEVAVTVSVGGDKSGIAVKHKYDLVLSAAGRYVIEIRLDGTVAMRVPFRVERPGQSGRPS
jgi:uncharacterized protein DUF6941